MTIQRDVEVRPEDTVLSCNLDGYFEWDGKSYGVEAKTTSFVEDWGEEGKDEVPGRVTIQCQVQCHVANLDGVFVPVLMPLHGRLAQRLFYVERCDELIDEIVPKLNQWWVRHVEAKEPPEATEKALEAIKRIERKGSKVAVLPEKLYNELEVTKQEIRKLEKVKSEIEAKLLSQLGDAEVGEIEGTDLELTYFKQSRTSYGVGAKYSEDKCPYCAVGKSTSEFRVARSRKVKLLSGPK